MNCTRPVITEYYTSSSTPLQNANPVGTVSQPIIVQDNSVFGPTTFSEQIVAYPHFCGDDNATTLFQTVVQLDPFIYNNPALTYPTLPDNIGGLNITPISVNSVANAGITIDPASGSFVGECTTVQELATLPVVAVSYFDDAFIGPILFDTVTMDATGQLYFNDKVVNMDDGTVVNSTVIVSDPFWVGFNCFKDEGFNSQPWFVVPFHEFPRIYGINEYQRPTSEVSYEYSIGLMGMAIPFMILCFIYLVLFIGQIKRGLQICNCFPKIRHGILKLCKRCCPNMSCRCFGKSTGTDYRSNRPSAHNQDGEDPVSPAEVRELIEQLHSEEENVRVMLKPTSWRLRVVAYVSGTLFLGFWVVIVIVMIVSFFSLTNSTDNNTGMSQSLHNAVTVMENSASLLQAFNNSLALLPSANCTLSASELDPIEIMVNQESSLVTDYLSITNTNAISVTGGDGNRDDLLTLGVILLIVVVVSLLAIPTLLVWAAMLTSCTFKWGKFRLCCNRSSVRVNQALAPVTVTSVFLGWALVGTGTFAFTLWADFCWNPSILKMNGFNATKETAEMYIFPPLDENLEMFNPAAFFTNCAYNSRDTASLPVTKYNPYSPGSIAAGKQNLETTLAISKTVTTANCPDFYSDTFFQETNPWITANNVSMADVHTLTRQAYNYATGNMSCDVFGIHTGEYTNNLCNASLSNSTLKSGFSLYIILMSFCVLVFVELRYLPYITPNLARLKNAEEYHLKLVRKREHIKTILDSYDPRHAPHLTESFMEDVFDNLPSPSMSTHQLAVDETPSIAPAKPHRPRQSQLMPDDFATSDAEIQIV